MVKKENGIKLYRFNWRLKTRRKMRSCVLNKIVETVFKWQLLQKKKTLNSQTQRFRLNKNYKISIYYLIETYLNKKPEAV